MTAAFRLHRQSENFVRGCCPTCGRPSNEVGDVYISGSTVIRGGECVRLGQREARLFEKLLKAWPSEVHKETLMQVIWPDTDCEPPAADITIKVYMCYLRKKLAPLGLGVTQANWAHQFYAAQIFPLELKEAS